MILMADQHSGKTAREGKRKEEKKKNTGISNPDNSLFGFRVPIQHCRGAAVEASFSLKDFVKGNRMDG